MPFEPLESKEDECLVCSSTSLLCEYCLNVSDGIYISDDDEPSAPVGSSVPIPRVILIKFNGLRMPATVGPLIAVLWSQSPNPLLLSVLPKPLLKRSDALRYHDARCCQLGPPCHHV